MSEVETEAIKQESAEKEDNKKSGEQGTMEDLIKKIESMSVLELSELVKALEDRFGVSAQAPVAVAAHGGATSADGGQAVVEEQTEFTVELSSAGEKKIQVIKEIRAITSLGLKEAKDLVEAAPKVVKEGLSKEDADKIKEQLEKVGAQIAIK